VINAVSKSGSNTIHGIAYFSDRDNDWGALNPFVTNTTNIGTVAAPSFLTAPYKPKDWRKEWGFDAGGALKKDKLFWFYGFAQYQRNFPGTGKANVPGSFFVLPDAAAPSGSNCNITGANSGYMSGVATSSIDQQACELAARLTFSGKGGYNTYAAGASAYATQLTNLLPDLGAVSRQGNEELNTPKLDWHVNDRNTVSFLFHRLRWDSPGGVQTQATNTYAIDSFGTDFVKLDYGLTKLDSLITSNISNEVRYQYSRELNDEGQQPLSAYTQQNLEGNNGVTNSAAGDFTPNKVEVALDTSIGFYLGSPYYSYRKALPDERKWQVGDTMSWQKGNHSFKFGADLIHNYDILNNTFDGQGVYSYSYIGNFFADVMNEGASVTKGVCNSASSPTAPGSSTTNYTGTALCGTMTQGFGPAAWDLATMDYGFFGEDHWKLTPRLTADLGIRYDYESLPAPYSSLTAASGTFVPYMASTNGLCSAYTGPGTCPSLAAQANITNHPSDKNNWGPRIGFAFDPYGDGKTTIRIGYGLYFGRVTNGVLLNNLLNTGSPLGQYTSAIKPNTAGAPIFPNIISAANGSTPSSYFFSSHFQNPQVSEFDASLQQALGRGTIFQLSFMGSLGRELPNWMNINLNPNASTVTTATTPNGVNTAVIRVADTTGQGPIPNGTLFTVPTYNNYINPNFGAVTEVISNVNSNYDAMVVEVENKSSKMVQFDVNYTWSHALDDNQNETTTNATNGAFDPYNIDGYYKGANYGNSQFNVPNRLVMWGLLNAPNVESNGWLKWVANDWSLNPVFQAQNGLPYSATIGSGFPSASAENSSWNGAGSTFWLPSIGRDTYKQPRTMVADLRLEKKFDIEAHDKTYHLQLLGEFFNIANHQNVTGVSSTAYNEASNSSVTGSCTVPNSTQTFGAIPGQAQIECANLTYQPKAGLGTSATGFGAVTNSNSNFAYSQRQVQLSLRLDF
jgi:hypothetical protein